MEGYLSRNKTQELNIRQSFLHLSNSNCKARVKIFFWEISDGPWWRGIKKENTNIYLFKQNNVIVFSLHAKVMLQKVCGFRRPHKT